MALQKSITLSNGSTGNYIRMGPYLWDPMAHYASAQLFLFTSHAFAESAPDSPLCMIAKLRLEGGKFDQYLANSILDADGVTVVGQLYIATRAEPLLAGAGFTAIDLSDAIEV